MTTAATAQATSLHVHADVDGLRVEPDSTGLDDATRPTGTSLRTDVDQRFDRAFALTGWDSYVTFPAAGLALGTGFTVSVWTWADELYGKLYGRLMYGHGTITLSRTENSVTVSIGSGDAVTLPVAWIARSWHHVAVVVAFEADLDSTVSVLVDGAPVGRPFRSGLVPPTAGQVSIGKWQHDLPPLEPQTPALRDRMAHLRLTYRPLSQRDVAEQMAADDPVADYATDAPLDFVLWDDQHERSVYVEGGEDQHPLKVALWNRDPLGRNITLAAPDGLDEVPAPTVEDTRLGLRLLMERSHHLELRFPEGSLAPTTVAYLLAELDRACSSWSATKAPHWFAYPRTGTGLGYDSILLLSSDGLTVPPASEAEGPPGLEVELANFFLGLDVEQDVVAVELRPGRLMNRAGSVVLDPRSATVSVVSERGRRVSPLHLDVVGSNTILNDGSECALLLRLTNIDRERHLALDRHGRHHTRFVILGQISDHAGHQEWALTDETSNVAVRCVTGFVDPKVTPDHDEIWGDAIEPVTNGRMVEWELDRSRLTVDQLAPNESIYFKVTVRTTLATGPTDLRLDYRRLPGYWDGTRTVTVQKSPLVLRLGHVGIGTSTPRSTLSVGGSLTIGSPSFDSTQTAPHNGLLVEGESSFRSLVTVGGSLTVGSSSFVESELTASGGLLIEGASEFRSSITVGSPAFYAQVGTPANGLLVEGGITIGTPHPPHHLPERGPTLLTVNGQIHDEWGPVPPIGTIAYYPYRPGRYFPYGWDECDGRIITDGSSLETLKAHLVPTFFGAYFVPDLPDLCDSSGNPIAIPIIKF